MPSTGERIRSWTEEINGVFAQTLTQLPDIQILENQQSYGKTTIQNGEVYKTEISFRINGRITKSIVVQLFYPRTKAAATERCIYPGCINNKYSWFDCCRRWFTSTVSTTNERYLCPEHVCKAKAHVQMLCKVNGVRVSCSDSVNDYNQFMTMCSLMDKAANSPLQILQEITNDKAKADLVRELLVNVRNYLVIIDSLLVDVQGDLLTTLLPFIMDTTLLILKSATYNQPIQLLVNLAKNIIEDTLYFFGIMYPWESISTGNPYRQLGTGLGGMAAVICTVASRNPVGLVGMGVLGVIGGVVGDIYYLHKRTKEQMEESLRRYHIFRQIHQENCFPMTHRTIVVTLLSVLVAVLAMYIAACLVYTRQD